MIALKPISDSAASRHLELMRDRFDAEKPAGPLAGLSAYPPYIDDLLAYLDRNFDAITSGSPQDIARLAMTVGVRFPDFAAQARLSRASKAWKQTPTHAAAVRLVEKCFDYEKFSQKSGDWNAYSLVEAIDARICPYCRLHHVNYHMPKRKGGFSLRPPLDHFLPKSAYPYLAVALGNLIPCCSQCNSGIKLAQDPLGTDLQHPNTASSTIKFSAIGSIPVRLNGSIGDVRLTLIPSDAHSSAHINFFKLRDRYTWYAREVFDLIENYNRFLDYSKELKEVIWMKEFVLGFNPQTPEIRALGHCLVDVLEELDSGLIV